MGGIPWFIFEGRPLVGSAFRFLGSDSSTSPTQGGRQPPGFYACEKRSRVRPAFWASSRVQVWGVQIPTGLAISFVFALLQFFGLKRSIVAHGLILISTLLLGTPRT